MTWLTRRAWLVPLPAALFCCSFVLDPAETQCATDGDCTSRGGAFATSTCVQNTCQSLAADSGDSELPDAGDADAADAHGENPLWCQGMRGYIPPDQSRKLPLTQQFVQQSDQEPIGPGRATIKLCARSDLACSTPRAVLDTDESGFVRTEVEYGFTGYFDIVVPGLQPSIYVVPPLTESYRAVPLQVLNPANARFLAQTILGSDVTIEPTLGHTIMAITDCNQMRFGGISVNAAVVDSQNRTRAFYIRSSGIPSPGGTETNELGQAGFINLPPGIANITGTLNAQQKRVVGIEMPMRANYFSYALLSPEDFQP